ncbi:MAG: chemotaxis protein CheD [Candidatus Fimivivens sp.]
MKNTVKVGIADMSVVTGEDELVTFALGSCVAICLHDAERNVAGMAHIMLPDSRLLACGKSQPLKFADTALIELVKAMQFKGARAAVLTAKIAGGAQMFAVTANSPLGNIGLRNTQAVKAGLARFHIPILVEDTGKDYGRTCYFDAPTGTMLIRSVLNGEWRF